MIDRKTFFDNVKTSLFSGAMNQGQVDGMTAIIDYWETNHLKGLLVWLAYILATAYHETEFTMQPRWEKGRKSYFFRMYDINGSRPDVASRLGNINPGDGERYKGGGLVQLTGRANYALQGIKHGIDLLNHPEMILDLPVSVKVLTEGMLDGDFSGRSLDRYTDKSGGFDPVHARKTVNGTDCASTIANYYRAFLTALEAAQTAYKPPEPPPQPLETPVETKPPQPAAELPPDWADYQAWKIAQTPPQEPEVQADNPTKPFWQSKILLTVVGTGLSTVAARYGLDIPPDQMANVITGITGAGGTLVGLFRIFATHQPIGK